MKLLAAVFALLLAPPASAALVAGAPEVMPVSRVQFQGAVAGLMRDYSATLPAAGLAKLETIAALPAAQFPTLAAERAAARAALALIVSPRAEALRDDRETRVPFARALGKANAAAIVSAARDLRMHAAADPALAASVERMRERFAPSEPGRTDLAEVAADLRALFDRARADGYESVAVDGAAGGLLIPVHRSGLAKPAPAAAKGLASRVVPEGAGFVTTETGPDGRERREVIYPQDGLSFERRAVPAPLAGVYEELPGGALRMKKADPLAAALDAAGIDLWTVRHGETETSRALVLAGRGSDAALTDDGETSGRTRARAAALALYESLGGDAWARTVAAGLARPVVILTSPLRAARQTAGAFSALLERKARALGGRTLYEAHVERGLAEIAFGTFEGRTLEKARTLAAWAGFDPFGGPGRNFLDRFPGGESRFDVLVRQRGVLRRMIKEFAGRQVVTFAHFESVAAQKAVLGRLDRDPKDGALKAAPGPSAEPVRLSFAGAATIGR